MLGSSEFLRFLILGHLSLMRQHALVNDFITAIAVIGIFIWDYILQDNWHFWTILRFPCKWNIFLQDNWHFKVVLWFCVTKAVQLLSVSGFLSVSARFYIGQLPLSYDPYPRSLTESHQAFFLDLSQIDLWSLGILFVIGQLPYMCRNASPGTIAQCYRMFSTTVALLGQLPYFSWNSFLLTYCIPMLSPFWLGHFLPRSSVTFLFLLISGLALLQIQLFSTSSTTTSTY